MENGIELFNKVMNSAMAFPGVKVDRKQFLTKELRSYCTEEQLAQALINPVGTVSVETLDRIADACISYHTRLVTGTSALAGLPGGWTLLGTVPADLAQYYGHALTLAQKLAYIYGYPDLTDENGELAEEAFHTLTVFLGVMTGVDVANKALRELSKRLAFQALKRIPKQALTKTVWYPLIKQTAKWVGVKMSKDIVAKGASKFIPLIGAVISGTLTFATFRPSAKRLQKKMRAQLLDRMAMQKTAAHETTNGAEAQ